MEAMLENILGNATAEKVLLHIYYYGESHAPAIAEDFMAAATPVRGQLDRFERAGILRSKLTGSTRIYRFNEKSPLLKPVRELLRIAYESLSEEERKKYFGTRRRSRRAGKPVQP